VNNTHADAHADAAAGTRTRGRADRGVLREARSVGRSLCRQGPPLVIAGPRGAPKAWDWIDPDLGPNQRWSGGEWTNEMIQLVICPESAEPKASGSCGTYTRSDGSPASSSA